MTSSLIESLKRLSARAGEAEDKFQPDESKGERWVTSKDKKHKFVINAKHQIVFGSKEFLHAMAEKAKSGKEREYLKELEAHIAEEDRKNGKEHLSQGKTLGFGIGGNVAKYEYLRPDGAWPKQESAGLLKALEMMKSRSQMENQAVAWRSTEIARERGMGLRPSERKAGLATAISAVASYLVHHGDNGLGEEMVAQMQRNVAAACPELVKEIPEFFRSDFYERMLIKHSGNEQLKMDRQKRERAFSDRADKVTLPADAKNLVDEIKSEMERYGDSQVLRDAMARADAIANGSVPVDDRPKRKPLEDPPFPETLDGMVSLGVLSEGSTKPRLLCDQSGKKWVLKDGGGEGHAQSEWECSQAFRQLGFRAPASRMYGNQRLSEFVEGKTLGRAIEELKTSGVDRAEAQAKVKGWVDEIREAFPAAVAMGCHDMLGDDLDNIMIGEDGHAWLVDCGGSLGRGGTGTVDPEWEAGWIDDLWHMRGMSPSINGSGEMPEFVKNHPELVKFFGKMDTNDILQAIDQMDWKKATAHMAESQFKKGEKIPGTKFEGQSTRLSTGNKEVMERRIRELKDLAGFSRSVVGDGAYGANGYNDRLLKMLYGFAKTSMRETAAAGKGLYDQQMSGFVRQQPMSDLKSKHLNNTLVSENIRGNLRSVDQIIKKMAQDNGIDLRRTDVMMNDQGKHSSAGTHANKLKVMELFSKGYSLEQIANGEMEIAPHVRKQVMDTAHGYLQNGGSVSEGFKSDLDALMLRKAANMQFIHNAGLPNYDPQTRRLLAVRTEDPAVLGDYVLQHPGEVLGAYPRDSHASFSWYQTCSPFYERHLVAMSVPLSCITSCDMMTTVDGRNLYNQQNRRESEIGVNAVGLPFVYLGEVNEGTPISDCFRAVAEAERKSGRTLSGESLVDQKDYIRKAAPWARETSVM